MFVYLQFSFQRQIVRVDYQPTTGRSNDPQQHPTTTSNNNIDINQYELFPSLNLAVYSHILLVWTAQHWVWTKIPNKNQSVCRSCRLPEGIRAPNNLHGPVVNLSQVRCRHQQILAILLNVTFRTSNLTINLPGGCVSPCFFLTFLICFPWKTLEVLIPQVSHGTGRFAPLRRGAHREATAMYLKSWHAYRPALTTLKMQVAMAVRPNTSSTAKRWTRTWTWLGGTLKTSQDPDFWGVSNNLWGG